MSTYGHKYYVLFLDDYLNFLWTFPISHKSQVFPTFEKLISYIETQFQLEVKNIQCDNDRKYANSSFQKLYEANGILFNFPCPHTLSQNGKAGRKFRFINNIIWHHDLQLATYLLNILQNKKVESSITSQNPFSTTPFYSYLRVFGCLCYTLFSSTTINKL